MFLAQVCNRIWYGNAKKSHKTGYVLVGDFNSL